MSTKAAAQTTLVPAEPTQAACALIHKPTAIEIASDLEDLDVIRKLFGSRSQTLINILLAFDAFFNWYYPLKDSIEFDCDVSKRQKRALENAQLAIDLHEITERLTARGQKGHKSYLFHAAIYKITRDILQVGDVWATGSAPLELQNAETKRVAESSSSRRSTLTARGKYTTTTAISLLNHLLSTRYLRRGDGIYSMRDSRRMERVFGANGIGRLALKRSLKHEKGSTYDPRQDTCIKAFVRLLAENAMDSSDCDGDEGTTAARDSTSV